MTAEQREEFKRSLLDARAAIDEALAKLDDASKKPPSVRPVRSTEPPPYDPEDVIGLLEDARTLFEVGRDALEVFADAAKTEAARTDPRAWRAKFERAFAASINLQDFVWPTWKRVTPRDLQGGFEVTTPNGRALFGFVGRVG